ncbi:MAG: AMP-binding protein [Desulfosudaceae bacterium]
MPVNTKNLIRNYAGFVNFRSMIRLLLGLPTRKNRPFLLFEDAAWTYSQVLAQSRRYAAFFLARRRQLIDRGLLEPDQRLKIGIYQDNTPEYLFAAFGAGLSNSILFAVNTGFRGRVLTDVINQAGVRLLLTNPGSLDRLAGILDDIPTVGENDLLLLESPAGEDDTAGRAGYETIEAAMSRFSEPEPAAAAKARPAMDNTSPVLVIYTSGTTGLPKGVPCTHLKMIGAGTVVQSAVHLKKDDRGYVSMPLFHSNAWYVGMLPIMIAGASVVLKRKFSASAFEDDLLSYGITYLNYVGQPLHYIITALEKKYGSPEAVVQALAGHPDNRFRVAYGNGAPAVDRRKIKRYLGMEHVYEIYGSTEAVITTANKPGDPEDSVGRAPKSVVILDEEGRPCEPGQVDDHGRLLNYDRAVGEICKPVDRANSLRFDGYFDNEKDTGRKFRDGCFHSGDLGHIRIVNGKRYLFFNGRTDDWIRKDGENFSAETVQAYAQAMPGVRLAVAYGVPCAVSDELVMVTVQMEESAEFDPGQAFDWLMDQQEHHGMDPKWMPDYIRVIDAFTLTNTQKILVRPFKRQHFNIESHPDMTVYYRQRGDTTYHRLTPEAFQEIKQQFAATGRQDLLETV